MFTAMAKEIARTQGQKEASRGDPSILLGFLDSERGTDGRGRYCCSGSGTPAAPAAPAEK